MREKGTIIKVGNVNSIKLPDGGLWLTQTIVMGYGPELSQTATIDVVGSERVERLQKLKVGDPITIEFRGKWYLIMRDHAGNYNVVMADKVEM